MVMNDDWAPGYDGEEEEEVEAEAELSDGEHGDKCARCNFLSGVQHAADQILVQARLHRKRSTFQASDTKARNLEAHVAAALFAVADSLYLQVEKESDHADG